MTYDEYDDPEEIDYENEDEEESDGLILSFGKDGKVDAIKQSDYENTIEKQQEIIMEFMKENGELFSKFLEKKGISEDEFNGKIKDTKITALKEKNK